MNSPTGNSPTPVARLVARLLAESDPTPTASDDQIAARCDRLADLTASLAKLPSTTWSEVEAKLAVLTTRLRGDLNADDAEAVRTALLAEAIRDDVRRLARLALTASFPGETCS
jgi:hypothetical protein